MLGHSVCVFPEGTTTRGNSLAPFHSSAFQAALDAKAKVTPIALKYLDANRVQTDRIAYVNDMTFMRSLDQIIVEKSHVAEVTFLPSIEARSMKRGDVSDMSRKMISSSLFN
jgi:1-acyl-sn-glycerol-3-phosphate acyltransferase